MRPVSLVKATAEVASRDPVMARLIAEAGPVRLRRRGTAWGMPGPGPDGHFAALCRSILFQQLAGAAAAAIHARFLALFPEGRPTPAAVLALEENALRSAGLSGSKVASIRDLAARAFEGTVVLEGVESLSDDEIVDVLTAVRGIGPWTAEMFLIFRLGRRDVWPVTDYGVRKGWALAYGLPALPTAGELRVAGERFRPYRTVAAWYCWRAADTRVPGPP